jgi:hypothetical protein
MQPVDLHNNLQLRHDLAARTRGTVRALNPADCGFQVSPTHAKDPKFEVSDRPWIVTAESRP